MAENTARRDADKFPCPACGGGMFFDPESGGMKCEFCENTIEFEKEGEGIKEYDFFDAPTEPVDDEAWGENISIKCSNCGAETILNPEAISDFCAFCGSAHIVKQDQISGIPPESVLPFAITRKIAKQSFRHWLRKRFFAPRALKTETSVAKLNGTYVPYWTYDSSVSYVYSAQAGTHYNVTAYRTVGSKRESYQQQKTRWRNVHGNSKKDFDDIQIRATDKVPPNILGGLEPFPLKDLAVFKPEFLSGFIAERYSINLQDGWESAKQKINSDLESEIRDAVAADEVRDVKLACTYNNVLYKHILVPIWLSTYLFKDKTYQIMVNGANGRVSGTAPVSVGKVILTVFVVLAIAAALFFILSIT